MKILITGATGFIGSHLVKQLLIKNHDIFCTLLENEKNPFGEHSVKSIVWFNQNINENIVFLKKNNIDGVIHLASFVQSGEHKSSEIESIIDTNIKFGVNLLETAVQAQVKWFINTGTYWQNYNSEDYSPVNLYAATKQAFMDIGKYYWETDAIKFVTLKLFDTFGSNETRPKIFKIWECIAKSGETLDMSKGEQLIDILHIDDIVDAFCLLVQHVNINNPVIKNGDVYAVKAEKRYSLKELASIFEESLECNLNINWGAKPYKNREIMIPWEGGKSIPDWKPKCTLKMGIQKTFAVW